MPMKKLFTTLIYTLLALSVMGAAPITTTDGKGNTYTLNSKEKTAELTKGANIAALTIPGEIEYNSETYTVVSIGASAFKNYFRLSNVTISENIISIGDEAFSTCEQVTEITLPNSLKTIGASAFYGCKTLGNITIPNNVTEIGASAFEECNAITTFIFPDGVKHISDRILYNCKNIETLKISPYTETIGVYSFRSCVKVTELDLPNTLISIGEDAFFSCTNITEFKICENVVSIGNEAFGGCTHLQSLYVEGGSTSLGSKAFNAITNLNSLNIYVPDTRYDYYIAADGWKDWKDNIKQMTASGTTFEFQGLKYIVTDETAKTAKLVGYKTATGNLIIPEKASKSGVLYTVTSIGTHALNKNNGLISVSVASTVKTIADYVFAECANLESVTLPDGLEKNGAGVFYGCTKLNSITLPTNITTITESMFDGCASLSSITIKGQITAIGNRAMYGCAKIESLEFSDVLGSIGNNAFYGCAKLATIKIAANNVTLGTGAFDGLPDTFIIYGPASRLKTYKVAQNWSSYADHIKAEGVVDEVKLINGLYYEITDFTDLTVKLVGYETVGEELVIPDEVEIDDKKYKVTYIDANALEGASNLTQIVVPETILTINATAFYGIPSTTKIYVYEIKYEEYIVDPNWAAYLSMLEVIATVNDFTQDGIKYKVTGSDKKQVHIVGFESSVATDIELPLTVKYENKIYTLTGIDENAFKDCAKLASITFTDNINEIGAGAFSGCTSLKTFTLPKNVSNVADNLLTGCTSLTTVTLHENVTSIGDYSFANCTKITEMKIPESVAQIGKGAFMGCNKLEKVNIPEVVTIISDDMFHNCYLLDSVSFSPNVTTIGKNAFYSCKRIKVVDIPKNITSIGETAFYGCETLNLIVVYSENCKLGKNAFTSIASSYKIYVPESRLNYYKTAENWVMYSNFMKPLKTDGKSFLLNGIYYRIIDFDNYLVQIFGYESVSTKLTIPDTVTFNDKKYAVKSIADKSFADCTVATEITLPKTIDYIGKSAFFNCAKLTKINIPENVTAINEYTFAECAKLRTIAIPEGVTKIGEYAFANCDALTTANLPPNLEAINRGIFQGCHHLLNVVIPDGIETVAANAFTDCSYLADVKFSNDVKTIEKEAFANNRTFEYLEFPETLTDISENAFYGCWILKKVIVRGENTKLGEGAFDECDKITIIYVPITALEKYKAAENWSKYKDIIKPLYFTKVTTDYGCTTDQRSDMLMDSTITFTVDKDFELKVLVNGEDMTESLVQNGNTYSLKIINLSEAKSIRAITSLAVNQSGYYEIANEQQLYWFVEHVSQDGNQKANGIITADIVCNTNVVERVKIGKTAELRQWYPNYYTGEYRTINRNAVFEGKLNGNGHTISGIYINDTTLTNAGLFQTLKGTIENLAITDSYILTKENSGIVCGNNLGTISGCYIQGETKGKNNVGGIAGTSSGKIENCIFEGKTTGENNVGTIAGENKGTISSVITYGTTSGNNHIGVICGANSGTASNCRYFTEITKMGAIDGKNDSTNFVYPTTYLEGASKEYSSHFDTTTVFTAGNTVAVSSMAELTLPYLTNFEALSKKDFIIEIKIDGYTKSYFTGRTINKNGYLLVTDTETFQKDTFQISSPEVTIYEPDMMKARNATIYGTIYDLDFSYKIQLIPNPTPVSTVDVNGVKVWGYGSTLYIENAENRKIEIFDLSGRLIKTEECTNNRLQITLRNGFYLVKIGGSIWKVNL